VFLILRSIDNPYKAAVAVGSVCPATANPSAARFGRPKGGPTLPACGRALQNTIKKSRSSELDAIFIVFCGE
jgi:hypothetical protein